MEQKKKKKVKRGSFKGIQKRSKLASRRKTSYIKSSKKIKIKSGISNPILEELATKKFKTNKKRHTIYSGAIRIPHKKSKKKTKGKSSPKKKKPKNVKSTVNTVDNSHPEQEKENPFDDGDLITLQSPFKRPKPKKDLNEDDVSGIVFFSPSKKKLKRIQKKLKEEVTNLKEELGLNEEEKETPREEVKLFDDLIDEDMTNGQIEYFDNKEFPIFQPNDAVNEEKLQEFQKTNTKLRKEFEELKNLKQVIKNLCDLPDNKSITIKEIKSLLHP